MTTATTTKAEPLTPELLALLQKVAKKCNNYSLMDSKWQNSEAETIASQCLASCALNHREHGDAFSWASTNLDAIGGNGLVNNPDGLGRLTRDGSIIVEEYNGPLKPKKPSEIQQRNGKFLVLRVTAALIYYAASELKVK